ncbi:MAG TPA: hypothetical protein VMA34_15390 [Terracidiphilus sp.]|nr:hypothetical protein [Terracidiphilus sp.]
MHIHGHSMGIPQADFQSANLQSRAAIEAQRAARVSKRLLNAAQPGTADITDEESLLIGRWLGTTGIPPHGGDPDEE